MGPPGRSQVSRSQWGGLTTLANLVPAQLPASRAVGRVASEAAAAGRAFGHDQLVTGSHDHYPQDHGHDPEPPRKHQKSILGIHYLDSAGGGPLEPGCSGVYRCRRRTETISISNKKVSNPAPATASSPRSASSSAAAINDPTSTTAP